VTSPGGTLTERLQLVVDATTQTAETKFQKLTGAARETGEAAQRSSLSVRDAADRVAAARDRELTASGNLRVAETRLEALRQGGRARADQLAAAEERVATAQRTLHMATRSTQRATEDQTQAQRNATTEMDRGERSGGRLRGQLDGLVSSAAALGGAGLGVLLRGLGEGFATGARNAGLLATSMNANVEEAGAFLGLVGSLGLELNDLLEIQAEFAQKVTDNGAALQKLGVETDRNADGTVNWANTLVSFLDRLQGVEDATERNRLGFMFLGEEGFKQLSKLVNSGTDVRDALEMIGTPFTDEDVRMAADYDAAMLELSLTSQRAQQSLGRLLLPVLSGIAEGIGDVVDVVEDVPLPLGVATVAALTLGLTGFNPAAAAGARLAGVMAAVSAQIALYNVAAAIGGRSSALLAGGMGAASAAGGRLMALAGGPLGLALLATAGLYTLVQGGVDDFREASRRAAQQLEEDKESYDSLSDGAEALGRRLADEAGTWDGLAASRRGAVGALEEQGGALSTLDDISGGALTTLTSLADRFSGGHLAAKGFTDEIENQRKELGAFGAQQETVQTTTKALNDLIAEGTTTGEEFAEAIRAAAEAQEAETRTSDLAKAALDAYNATTRDAVETTLALWNAQLQQRDGLIGVQQAIHEAHAVVDDLTTPWNEVGEATNRVIGTTLDYASTAADAAVAAAKAQGEVVTAAREAQIRGEATITALREAYSQPGITASAQAQIADLVAQLETAQENGDIEAVLSLTGAVETAGVLDDTTKDRDTTVRVESRNGPAVQRYLDGLAEQRLTIIRVESRNGPAVDDYLNRLRAERLAIIRVETRGGPDVDRYLDSLATQQRTATIDVRRPTGAAGDGGTGAAAVGMLTAGSQPRGDTIIHNLTVQATVEGATGRLTPQSLAEAGRNYVHAIAAYNRRNRGGRGVTP
jgi:hypothetical protein